MCRRGVYVLFFLVYAPYSLFGRSSVVVAVITSYKHGG
jgi:hypothetical protein